MASLLLLVLRRRRSIAAWALVLGGLALAYTVLTRPTYSSVSQFTPQTRLVATSLSGLAAQFGLGLPIAGGNESPSFYADLLMSRELLGAAVESTYTLREGTGPASLVDLLDVDGPDEAVRREEAIEELAAHIRVGVAQRTGVVTLEVEFWDPVLAHAVNSRLLALLNQFNVATRQSQASAERRFIERRLEEVRQEQREAEDRLQLFLQRNRDYQNSPMLVFEYNRLSREVALRQEVASTLAQSYEQARIEEVRDIPVITVVRHPEVPARPDRRYLGARIFLGMVFGAAVGIFLGVLSERIRAQGDQAGPLQAELRAMWQEIRRGVLRKPPSARPPSAEGV